MHPLILRSLSLVLFLLAAVSVCKGEGQTKGYRDQSPVYKYTITKEFVVRVKDFMADSDQVNRTILYKPFKFTLEPGQSTLVTEFPLPVESVPGAVAVFDLIGGHLDKVKVKGPADLNTTTETTITEYNTSSADGNGHNSNGTYGYTATTAGEDNTTFTPVHSSSSSSNSSNKTEDGITFTPVHSSSSSSNSSTKTEDGTTFNTVHSDNNSSNRSNNDSIHQSSNSEIDNEAQENINDTTHKEYSNISNDDSGSISSYTKTRDGSESDSISSQAETDSSLGIDRDQIERVSALVQKQLIAFLTDQKALHTQKQSNPRGQATQTTSSHVIELLFVVDYVLYVTFLQRNGLNPAATLLDIQTYYSQVLRATNERFASATSGSFSVTLTLSGIFVAETAVASPWTELFKDIRGNVDPVIASPSFSSFGLGLNLTFPHDLPVLFTGYNLMINSATPSPGYSPLPGFLCSVIGVVWIQDTQDELTPRNLARFVAQSIGIQNDGANGCSNENLNIMSTSTLLPVSPAVASNPWSFSSCSVTELRAQLDNSALVCTKQTASLFPFNTAPFLGELFGQRYDADRQCSNSQRPVSRLCRELYFPPSTLTFDPGMCYNLLCQSGASCVQTLAHDGTSCGNSKLCLRGQCVSNVLAPFRPVNCPQLDDPTVTCTPASCFDLTLRTIQCCGTCNGLVESSTAFPLSVSTLFFQEEALFEGLGAAFFDFEE